MQYLVVTLNELISFGALPDVNTSVVDTVLREFHRLRNRDLLPGPELNPRALAKCKAQARTITLWRAIVLAFDMGIGGPDPTAKFKPTVKPPLSAHLSPLHTHTRPCAVRTCSVWRRCSSRRAPSPC